MPDSQMNNRVNYPTSRAEYGRCVSRDYRRPINDAINARPVLNTFHSIGVCFIQRLSRCIASMGVAKSAPRQVATDM